MADVGIATVKDIERGQGNPRLTTLLKIMEVLGMDIDFHIRKTV
ncbi:MAG: helix-turn-helix domain-containing protein [Bacteroidales bacterium]|nr:helix-turn-helix domain-containing protein [Bacteroidales bacterium]